MQPAKPSRDFWCECNNLHFMSKNCDIAQGSRLQLVAQRREVSLARERLGYGPGGAEDLEGKNLTRPILKRYSVWRKRACRRLLKIPVARQPNATSDRYAKAVPPSGTAVHLLRSFRPRAAHPLLS